MHNNFCNRLPELLVEIDTKGRINNDSRTRDGAGDNDKFYIFRSKYARVTRIKILWRRTVIHGLSTIADLRYPQVSSALFLPILLKRNAV